MWKFYLFVAIVFSAVGAGAFFLIATSDAGNVVLRSTVAYALLGFALSKCPGLCELRRKLLGSRSRRGQG